MVDYSKWKNIEISDDEDETHPNIDTPSLFRWRHQARMDRMEEHQKQVQDLQQKKVDHSKKVSELKAQLQESEKSNNNSSVDELKRALKELEIEDKKLVEEAADLKVKEKKAPWNIDTISKEGFTKTVFNTKPSPPIEEDLTDEQREARMRKFIKQYEKEVKHYGMLRRYDDSRNYLKAHNHLVCEDTANYLVIWCINLEVEEKHDLMQHVAHQTICMQFILELAKQLKYDPRACLESFFAKIQVAEPEYKASFDEELRLFKERIKKRAAEKIEEALKEHEEEERTKRLGPGGLDPVEVFESLPVELQQCFESQDVSLLKETIAKMDETDARYHMKRCIQSGLWIPDASESKVDEEPENATSR